MRYDYYRDSTVALEAFKAGEYDFREENNSKMWASMYSGETFESELTVRAEIPHELPRGMQGFAFNLRRPIFKDRKVREAIGYAFDFEWSNKISFMVSIDVPIAFLKFRTCIKRFAFSGRIGDS